jgi:hypothetical protein
MLLRRVGRRLLDAKRGLEEKAVRYVGGFPQSAIDEQGLQGPTWSAVES